ncbi:unnamed protein product [Sphagnum troendelagicum]|uniref:UTP--glucose-1-phosphate uridylyltransferase n=1 Tax=Sphagnum troendelagicum TaxID=128251 RepID=A0ABP0URN4_9BRYO
MSATTGLDGMSVAPRLSRAVQKLERWAVQRLRGKNHESIAWDKINPRTDLKVLTYRDSSSILEDCEKCKLLLDKLVVVKICVALGRALGSSEPKSLIEVRSGKSFIDIIVEHIEVLNSRYGTNILLILATSDNTDEPLSQAVRKYSNSHLEIVTFNQTEYTREVWPVRSKLGEDGRYLTNNGDLFAALAFSGKLEELIAQGKEILFIADSENLGASVDLNILMHLHETQSEYCMEVSSQRIGGVEGCARLLPEGSIELLEFEEVPEKPVDATKSSEIMVLNTNSLWVNLKAVKRLAENEALEIFCSLEAADGKKEISYQLQTASGDPLYSVSDEMFDNLPIEGNSDLLLIQFFDGAVAINVPGSRFLPVRATSELLILQSDVYDSKDGCMCRNSLRESVGDPIIDFDGFQLKKIGGFRERMKNVPSLLALESLKVVGDVWFGKDIVLQGQVVIWAKKDERLEIPDGATIKDKLVTSGPMCTDLSLVNLELESALWSQEKESDPNTFEEQDFPVQPPEWLDMDTYQRRKQELVGKPVWVQDVADEELGEIGYSSWKAYAVDSCMSNW